MPVKALLYNQSAARSSAKRVKLTKGCQHSAKLLTRVTAAFEERFLGETAKRTTIPPCSGVAFEGVVSITGREAGNMKLLTGSLAAMLLLAGAGTSHAVVRIANDRGGQIGRYVERYEQLRASGQTVVIDGLCASSCTILLGAIPHERICVTRNANLAFHAAWDFGAHGRPITNPGATRMLYSCTPRQSSIGSLIAAV